VCQHPQAHNVSRLSLTIHLRPATYTELYVSSLAARLAAPIKHRAVKRRGTDDSFIGGVFLNHVPAAGINAITGKKGRGNPPASPLSGA